MTTAPEDRKHIRCYEFDKNRLTLNGVKALKGPGGKAINIGYAMKPGMKPSLLFSTIKIQTPFGAKPYVEPSTGKTGKTTMALNVFPELGNMCAEIDAFIWEKMVENASDWFGRTITKEACKVYFEGCLKSGKNGYPDLLNVKFQKKLNIDGTESKQFNVSAFLDDGTPLVLDEDNITTMIPPRSEVVALIRLRTFYIIGNKNVYPSFDIVQLVITPAASISEHLLLNEAGITPKLIATSSGEKRLYDGKSEKDERAAMLSEAKDSKKLKSGEPDGSLMDVEDNKEDTEYNKQFAADTDDEDEIIED